MNAFPTSCKLLVTDLILSGHTVVLGSTLPLTGGRCAGLTTLPPSRADCLQRLGASTFLTPKGLCRPVLVHLYLYSMHDFSLSDNCGPPPLTSRQLSVIVL
jgi:hypothetical protein